MDDPADRSPAGGQTPTGNATAPGGPAPAPEQWAREPERGSEWLLRLMLRIAVTVGRRFASLLLGPIAVFFWLRTPAARAASREFLSRVWQRPAGPLQSLRHYRVFAQTILDRIYLLDDGGHGFDIRVIGEPVMLQALARGQGAFMVGAHLGSFEVLRAIGRRQPGLRVSMAMFEDNARKIGALLRSIDPRLELDVVALGRVDSMIEIQQRLDQGHFVGFLADRSFKGDAVVQVPFLGQPAPFPTGVFRMAAVLRQPVLMMAGLYRGGNRYEVYFDMLADFSDVARGERAARVEQAVTRYAARLEQHCRAAPFNWFNFYDFWSAPPGSPPDQDRAQHEPPARRDAGH